MVRTTQGACTGYSGWDCLDLINVSGDEITVRFWLQYTRANYADDTLKELRITEDSERWLIQTERNIQIINLDN